MHDRAGDGDAAHAPQVLERKVQADAEHHEDDADFGQLAGRVDVADEAGGEGADDQPGRQIANQRRQAQLAGEEAEEEGGQDGHRDRSKEGKVTVHSPILHRNSRFSEESRFLQDSALLYCVLKPIHPATLLPN